MAAIRGDLDKALEQLNRTEEVNLDSGVWLAPREKTDTGELRSKRRKELANHTFWTMRKSFSDSEFRVLAFTFNIDPDDLPGDTLAEKILAFVNHHYRHNRLRMLVDYLDGTRPEQKWKIEGYDLIDN